MTQRILSTVFTAALILSATVPVQAEVGLGADVVSRYIFRGTDFGNAATIQPSLSYSQGSLEIGAWSSWAITGGAAYENDLYATYSNGPIAVTVTDYYFPTTTRAGRAEFFNFAADGGSHTLEIMGTVDLEAVSVTAAVNVHGDDDDSMYLEVALPLSGEWSEGADVSVAVGAGNGVYTTDNKFGLVVLSVTASKDSYSASYILNPESELTFLVFGKSF